MDGCNDLCKYALVNDALEIWCCCEIYTRPPKIHKMVTFVYHIDRSVDLPRPDFCMMRGERIACDQTKGG